MTTFMLDHSSFESYMSGLDILENEIDVIEPAVSPITPEEEDIYNDLTGVIVRIIETKRIGRFDIEVIAKYRERFPAIDKLLRRYPVASFTEIPTTTNLTYSQESIAKSIFDFVIELIMKIWEYTKSLGIKLKRFIDTYILGIEKVSRLDTPYEHMKTFINNVDGLYSRSPEAGYVARRLNKAWQTQANNNRMENIHYTIGGFSKRNSSTIKDIDNVFLKFESNDNILKLTSIAAANYTRSLLDLMKKPMDEVSLIRAIEAFKSTNVLHIPKTFFDVQMHFDLFKSNNSMKGDDRIIILRETDRLFRKFKSLANDRSYKPTYDAFRDYAIYMDVSMEVDRVGGLYEGINGYIREAARNLKSVRDILEAKNFSHHTLQYVAEVITAGNQLLTAVDRQMDITIMYLTTRTSVYTKMSKVLYNICNEYIEVTKYLQERELVDVATLSYFNKELQRLNNSVSNS